MSKEIFIEEQRFNQWWLWTILLGSMLISLYTVSQKENMTLSDYAIPGSIFLVVLLLIYSCKLKTRIDEKGIHLQFFPFHLKTVSYPWNELYNVEVLKYSPIMDYGGWGLRISRKGKAFNVKGDVGIKIQTADGKTRMIGTQDGENAKQAIKSHFSKS